MPRADLIAMWRWSWKISTMINELWSLRSLFYSKSEDKVQKLSAGVLELDGVGHKGYVQQTRDFAA